MTMLDPATPGQVACEEWTRFHGSPNGFRPWEELPERIQAAWESVARAVLGTVAAELERLQEIEAEQSGRFRVKEIIKPDRDKDFYVGWSHVCEMPAWAGTREQALAEGCPPSRLRRADERGTSMHDDFGCAWDHGGLIAEQRGYLPRARIGDYATLYLLGRTQEAFDLLEPFDGETEVRRD